MKLIPKGEITMQSRNYFSHDYNARHDPKIVKLVQNEGWEGYGIFWAIIEILYEQGGKVDYNIDYLSTLLNTEKNKIERILNNYELFVNDNGKLTSLSLKKRMEQLNNIKSIKPTSKMIYQNVVYGEGEDVIIFQLNGGRATIKESIVNQFKEVYPAVNVKEELKRMKIWMDANPRKRKTPRGIMRFVNLWLSRTQDRAIKYNSYNSKNIKPVNPSTIKEL